MSRCGTSDSPWTPGPAIQRASFGSFSEAFLGFGTWEDLHLVDQKLHLEEAGGDLRRGFEGFVESPDLGFSS